MPTFEAACARRYLWHPWSTVTSEAVSFGSLVSLSPSPSLLAAIQNPVPYRLPLRTTPGPGGPGEPMTRVAWQQAKPGDALPHTPKFPTCGLRHCNHAGLHFLS